MMAESLRYDMQFQAETTRYRGYKTERSGPQCIDRCNRTAYCMVCPRQLPRRRQTTSLIIYILSYYYGKENPASMSQDMT